MEITEYRGRFALLNLFLEYREIVYLTSFSARLPLLGRYFCPDWQFDFRSKFQWASSRVKWLNYVVNRVLPDEIAFFLCVCFFLIRNI